MRLPAYPLITVDPFFSIWSMSDELAGSRTQLWSRIPKDIHGYVTVDGTAYRFMGSGRSSATARQVSLTVDYLTTEYVFECGGISLRLCFWTPLLLDDLQLLALPVSYLDYTATSLDGATHNVQVMVTMHANFCYDRKPRVVRAERGDVQGTPYACMYQRTQHPLSATGDGCSADWGTYYIVGEGATVGCSRRARISCTASGTLAKASAFSGHVIFGYNDGYAIEYFGEKLRGLWTERFPTIHEALAFAVQDKDNLFSRVMQWNERLTKDAAPYGEDYKRITSAVFRHVIAAHKLVRCSQGELLFLSKECNSNGCINTVDVSYPSSPLFLLYAPELVQGMLNGIFAYARLPVWKGEFAPHDIGQYPVANGQVYALTSSGNRIRRSLYAAKGDTECYNFNYQMPVEECGNMLIMAYMYAHVSGDVDYLRRHIDLMQQWADYLVGQGVVLANQLCTDDFAGHSEKNVNLAVKSCVGIALFGRICELCGHQTDVDYAGIAVANSQKLIELSREGDYLNFSIGAVGTWSMKYNMVWDYALRLGLFPADIYRGESAQYARVAERFGVPLDSRGKITKSDWMMWAAVLDESGQNVKLFSYYMKAFCEYTPQRVPFSDYYRTDCGEKVAFYHRSVQGGLFIPQLVARLLQE